MRIDDNIVLVPVRMTELGSEQTATRLEHTPDIITVNVRATGFNRDLVDNFLSCKLQIGVRDFRINDEASETLSSAAAGRMLHRGVEILIQRPSVHEGGQCRSVLELGPMPVALAAKKEMIG